MRIGIIGAGKIGGTLARRLAAAGHDVIVADIAGPAATGELVGDASGRVSAGSSVEAARSADPVVIAVPLSAWAQLPIPELAGKIVIDATNYYPARDGTIDQLESAAANSSDLFAALVPGARVVKAFNTIQWEHLRDAGRPAGDPQRLAIPIASDDMAAKQLVAGLADDLGFDPVDNGALADGRNQQPHTPVYNNPIGASEVLRLLGR